MPDGNILAVLSGKINLTHFFISLLTSILSEYCNDTIIAAKKRFWCMPKALFRCFICASHTLLKLFSLYAAFFALRR